MPAEKEVYFFASDRAYHRGRDWYLTLMLKGAPPGAVCGEATAVYAAGTPCNDLADNQHGLASATDYGEPLEEVIPRRIKECLPGVKLICVLRDPVERAYSHYRMALLSRVESRPFDEAIDQLMDSRALEYARATHAASSGYVVLGEYARILSGFLRVFAREQLMVIFSDELAQRPAETLASAFEFIGVATEFVPDNLDTRYLTAAVKQLIPGLNLFVWRGTLAHIRPARALWRALPSRLHGIISHAYSIAAYRIQLWNARHGALDDEMSRSTRLRLITHYRPDSEALSDLLGMEIPWLDEWSRA